MPAEVRTAPVHSLHDDLLWKIFSINANMFIDEGALTTTRLTSQVCQSWRSNLLNTTALWGRLIDFDSLHGLKGTEWAEELVRRSGTSLLWIKGKVNRLSYISGRGPQSNGGVYWSAQWPASAPPTLKQHTCFLSIIDANWQRIQRLVLSAHVMFDVTMWEDLSIFRRPALSLEQFSVESMVIRETRNTSARATAVFKDLFSGSAPELRRFSSSTIKIDVHAPWLHNLSSLQLGRVLDIYECLTVLSSTPRLQSLIVMNSNGLLAYSPHPVVCLPCLENIKFSLDFWEMAFMLDHLQVPPRCSLNLFTSPGFHKRNRKETIDDTFVRLKSSVYRATREHFQSHSPRALEVQYTGAAVIFRNDVSTFQIQCCSRRNLTLPLDSIFTSLVFPELAEGTSELKLNYIRQSSSTNFPLFLYNLSSVKVLHTDEQSLAHLISAQSLLDSVEGPRQILFPNLRRVKMYALPGRTPSTPVVDEKTISFIMSRIRDERPISTLDLTGCKEPIKISPAILNLKTIKGLKVIMKAETVSDT